MFHIFVMFVCARQRRKLTISGNHSWYLGNANKTLVNDRPRRASARNTGSVGGGEAALRSAPTEVCGGMGSSRVKWPNLREKNITPRLGHFTRLLGGGGDQGWRVDVGDRRPAEVFQGLIFRWGSRSSRNATPSTNILTRARAEKQKIQVISAHPEIAAGVRAKRGRLCRPDLLNNAQRGNGTGGKGSENEAMVLRTMPSSEKQGF